ncbi:MAG: DUF6403 family protein [Actinoplanes sp.]
MPYTWWAWPIGVALLIAAGFVAAVLPRRRQHRLASRTAWSAAQAAIAAAGVSRDAAPTPVPEAERLLLEAELLAAEHGGANAATHAAECARRADRLWRAAGR